jgi:hypothetical protein
MSIPRPEGQGRAGKLVRLHSLNMVDGKTTV